MKLCIKVVIAKVGKHLFAIQSVALPRRGAAGFWRGLLSTVVATVCAGMVLSVMVLFGLAAVKRHSPTALSAQPTAAATAMPTSHPSFAPKEYSKV